MADGHFGWDGKSVCGAEGGVSDIPDHVTCLKCFRVVVAHSNRIIGRIQMNVFGGSMADLMAAVEQRN